VSKLRLGSRAWELFGYIYGALNRTVRQAYESAILPYQGWLMQSLFTSCAKRARSYAELLRLFAPEVDAAGTHLCIALRPTVTLAPSRLFCSGRPRKFGIPGSFHQESSLPSNCQIFVNFSSQRGRARRLRGSDVGPLEGLRQVCQGCLEWRSGARLDGGSAGQHLCSHASPHCVHTMRFLSLCMPLTSRRGSFEDVLTGNPDLGVAGERRTGQGCRNSLV
jgi:hypothetical protein